MRKKMPPAPHLLQTLGTQRKKIGILGGSFNPAHLGHRQMSLIALKTLRLHEIWWLISPQNPLKTLKAAPLEQRLAVAKNIKCHPRIKVMSVEQSFHTPYTTQLLRYFRNIAPNARFVWIMGTDNLETVHDWHDWQTLFKENDVAVLARKGYVKTLSCKAKVKFRRSLLPAKEAFILHQFSSPHWVILPSRRHSASSTTLRQRGVHPC